MDSNRSFPFLPDHNPIIENRYKKVDELRAQGTDPYPRTFTATHSCSQALENADALIESQEVIAVAGRVLQIRSFGKAAFFHILDQSGKLQAYAKRDQMDEASFNLFKNFVDTGDWVGLRGKIFRTKTGEVTLVTESLTLLSKASRPLPEKWHGLTDVDLRYRMRYVDMIANPEVRETFRARSRFISLMRRRLDEQGFLEVETPMMHPIYGGASARPFITHHNTLDMDLYLRIAPELYLKRLVVGGFERVYEINRNFRNEGISTHHNPEFTMLELYAALWDYRNMMSFVEDLVSGLVADMRGGQTTVEYNGQAINFATPWPRVTILDALAERTGARFRWDMNEAEVRAEAARAGLHLPADVHHPHDLVIHLHEAHTEPSLIQPTYITEFPKSKCPLAKSKADNPLVTERFELFIAGMEIANAYSELNDPRDQYSRFAEQVDRRKGGDMEAMGEIDTDYVRALEYGMPPTSGLGVGIDRLVMILTNSVSIRDVILFPLMRPQAEDAAAAAQPLSAEDAPRSPDPES